jgi:hypothetical protein
MFSVSLVKWESTIHLMEELSTPEMLSLRGGADSAVAMTVGNVAIAVPIDILVGVAVGPGSQVNQGPVYQNAEAFAGNIFAIIAQIA